MRTRTLATTVAGIGAGLALVSACGTADVTPSGPSSSAAGSAPTTQLGSAASAQLATRDTALGTVLTDAQGHTLYRFDKDTPTTTACTAACASLWPPTPGAPATAPGATLPSALSTITRPDGTTQATYDGHPLYRYAKDTQPGQTTGDGVKGVWHVVLVTAAAAPTTTASH